MEGTAEIRPARPKTQSVALAAFVVDLDGTLLKTDLLLESLLALLRQQPRYLFCLPVWLLKGKVYLKQQISRRVSLDASILPYREDLLDYIKAQRAQGRMIILATGSEMEIGRQVADHLKVFDLVRSSGGGTNLGAEFKRDRRRPGFADYWKALRPHHWLKNLLVFVPLLAAHRFDDITLLRNAILSFVTFACFASGGYLINDLLDLSADRRHPRKRRRPFAAGDLSIASALRMIPALVGIGCLIGALVSPMLIGVAFIYLGLSLTYSLYFRQIVLLDVIVLAGLYTLRIIGGSASVAIWPSPWLLGFSTFLFLSLALVKRYSELALNHVKARGYELSDQELLASMGVASGYLATLVLALYINTETAHVLYRRYEILWLLCPLLLYWISHMWLSAHRGNMPDDPVVFASRDRTSRVLILLMLAAIMVAL